MLGELACGQLHRRDEVLSLLANLARSVVATEAEILQAIELHGLMGRGIGYVDAGLLTSCLLSGCRLWSLDRRLHTVAESLGLAHEPT